MHSDLLELTATFFDPNDLGFHAEDQVSPNLQSIQQIKFLKPTKRASNFTIQTQLSSSNSSPQQTPRRFGVIDTSQKKVDDSSQLGMKKQKDILPNQHALYASYNQKKQSMSQKILVTENSKKMFLQLQRSPYSIMQESISVIKQQKIPALNKELFKSVQLKDSEYSIYDLKSQLVQNNERFQNLVKSQQKQQQNYLLQGKKVYNEAKLNLQQRMITKPLKQRESLKSQLIGPTSIQDVFQNVNGAKVISPKGLAQQQQQSLQQSKLFLSSNGTFRMIKIKKDDRINPNYPKIIIPNYQSLQQDDVSHTTKQHISTEVYLPRIDSSRDQSSVEKHVDSLFRKSITAHEYQREDENWLQSAPKSSNIKTESSPVSPSVGNQEQAQKNTYGFVPQKQGSKSFLTRRPQAKIVSRIFSSRSDKN